MSQHEIENPEELEAKQKEYSLLLSLLRDTIEKNRDEFSFGEQPNTHIDKILSLLKARFDISIAKRQDKFLSHDNLTQVKTDIRHPWLGFHTHLQNRLRRPGKAVRPRDDIWETFISIQRSTSRVPPGEFLFSTPYIERNGYTLHGTEIIGNGVILTTESHDKQTQLREKWLIISNLDSNYNNGFVVYVKEPQREIYPVGEAAM
jgi:hypothetical protein